MLNCIGYFSVCPDRFNRYIVECKSGIRRAKLLCSLRFNRYIVECKFTRSLMVRAKYLDLIDT